MPATMREAPATMARINVLRSISDLLILWNTCDAYTLKNSTRPGYSRWQTAPQRSGPQNQSDLVLRFAWNQKTSLDLLENCVNCIEFSVRGLQNNSPANEVKPKRGNFGLLRILSMLADLRLAFCSASAKSGRQAFPKTHARKLAACPATYETYLGIIPWRTSI